VRPSSSDTVRLRHGLPVMWTGAHGGAGTTTLARLTGLGEDFGRAMPGPAAAVVVCCRASASGTAAAGPILGRWADPSLQMPRLLAVAVTAAAPGSRRPALVRERLRAWRQWGLPVFEIPWYADLLAVDDPAQVGQPPAVAALGEHLADRLAKVAVAR
jgi:hypothetical protein